MTTQGVKRLTSNSSGTGVCYSMSVMSNVFERFASNDLWNTVVCLQPPSLLIGKVWVPVMHFCACHISALESGQGDRTVQIDFNAAFDRVNHQGNLYKLCSMGICGSMLSILIQFLSYRPQHITVDSCWSKPVNVVSGVPQGSVLGPLLFLLYTSGHFSILENKLIGSQSEIYRWTIMVIDRQ